MEKEKIRCRLCGKCFDENDMSDEHYPAKSVGNYDIVAVNPTDYIDGIIDFLKTYNVQEILKDKDDFYNVTEKYFDEKIATSKYPKGRTARTLCRNCNTFLGKYDEAYLKFFNVDGEAKCIKGYSTQTKYEIIKSIFAKFLSIPETQDESFDYIEFVKNPREYDYNGKWKIYLVKRDHTTDMFGLKEINTRKLSDERGTIYEFSDEKFIYFLMDYEKEKGIEMTNIFEILNKNYNIVNGVGENGGYYEELLFNETFGNLE